VKIIRGQTISFASDGQKITHHENGVVVIESDGRIGWVGDFSNLPADYAQLPVDDHGTKLILPGFVDAHIHFPQHRILAAPGKDLLDWLRRFTFPEEARYGDQAYATAAAETFLDHLVTHGTTSALVFCSVHKTCATALFVAAEKRGMALVTGKTMMDRNAIPAVHDTAEQSAIDTADLHHTWHGKGRLRHAVTPRFAITSSEAQLSYAGELLRDLKGALMQTHISESPGEIAYVAKLFPKAKDYTDVYDHYGLLGPRSLFAHGIHLSDREAQRLSESGSSVVHCPTSNTFLGSGLMSMPHLQNKKRPVRFGLATDVGGGTSYSMLATMGEAYKVQMLNGYKPTATQLFAMATIGNAHRLHIAEDVGDLVPQKYADLVVLDPEATPVLQHRLALSQSLDDVLFSLMILGDDRAVSATYIAGQKIHARKSN
jgi:guanine deaminase